MVYWSVNWLHSLTVISQQSAPQVLYILNWVVKWVVRNSSWDKVKQHRTNLKIQIAPWFTVYNGYCAQFWAILREECRQAALSSTTKMKSETHCNKLQHAATHCNMLQHAAAHCSTMHHTATHCNTLQHTATHCNTPQTWIARYNISSSILKHAASRCNTLQNTATHCNTFQHTATHCNTLQHTPEFDCAPQW